MGEQFHGALLLCTYARSHGVLVSLCAIYVTEKEKLFSKEGDAKREAALVSSASTEAPGEGEVDVEGVTPDAGSVSLAAQLGTTHIKGERARNVADGPTGGVSVSELMVPDNCTGRGLFFSDKLVFLHFV